MLGAWGSKGPRGFGSVYENLLSLAATREAIGSGATRIIPQMNRALVECATHPAALTELEARLGSRDSCISCRGVRVNEVSRSDWNPQGVRSVMQ